jgi:serine protease
MKRSAIFLSLAVLIALVLSTVQATPALSARNGESVRVMVQYVHGQKGAAESALNGVGAKFHYAFDNLDAFAVTIPATALNGILHNPNFVLVEEDQPRYMIGTIPSPATSVSATDGIDPAGQVVPYGIDMVQARDVWDADRDGIVDDGAPTGSNRTICVIDSGLYVDHVDLTGINLLGGYPTGWNTDYFGHGTHVVGTIAAVNNNIGVVGVTPGTINLYIVKVFGDDGAWAYSSTLVDAANRCASAGANIISMSLGGSKSSTTEQRAFNTLYNNGILSVAAAGNDGSTIYNYPGSYASVVSVAAIDSSMVVADFSNQNDQVDLAAPGVAVLSTLPYIDTSVVSVDGLDYIANHIEYSGRGAASGALVAGGLCDSVGAWAGMVVLCERGTIDFYTKVANVQSGGGVAAVIYNNVSGTFLGTLGEGNTSIIIGVSLSQEDGQYLVANKLGSIASVSSAVTIPASGYEAWDGTSMATPHVSAAAALVWSSRPSATNTSVRDALYATAHDLGTAGRDNAYGYGLVQAYDAYVYLNPIAPTNYTRIADLDKAATWVTSTTWKGTVTITVKDAGGAVVPNATVTGAWSGGYTATVTCVTNTAGQCSVSTANLKKTVTSVTFTVTNVTHATLTYYPAVNSDPDGDSTGTVITIAKP